MMNQVTVVKMVVPLPVNAIPFPVDIFIKTDIVDFLDSNQS